MLVIFAMNNSSAYDLVKGHQHLRRKALLIFTVIEKGHTISQRGSADKGAPTDTDR